MHHATSVCARPDEYLSARGLYRADRERALTNLLRVADGSAGRRWRPQAKVLSSDERASVSRPGPRRLERQKSDPRAPTLRETKTRRLTVTLLTKAVWHLCERSVAANAGPKSADGTESPKGEKFGAHMDDWLSVVPQSLYCRVVERGQLHRSVRPNTSTKGRPRPSSNLGARRERSAAARPQHGCECEARGGVRTPV